MIEFTGWQYLLIDVANNYGLDKELFETRIQWAESNLGTLESLAPQADNKPRFLKSCMAIRKAQRGEPSGHLVGFDAVCSGVQIMSALTGCVAGATATGLVNPNVRADAYTQTTREMNNLLGGGLTVPRQDAKDALMTSMYGSRKKPKDIFGENTPELSAFYQAVQIVAPGAWELLQDLLASWQPMALVHAWKLPDGYDARVKVMQKEETRIEVDELGHATFTYEYWINQGSEKGLSLVANVTHSVDAFVLRELIRRCNYDRRHLESINEDLQIELFERNLYGPRQGHNGDTSLDYFSDLYSRSGMPTAAILPEMYGYNIRNLSDAHLRAVKTMVNSMLAHKPFEIVSIHDEFQCHANNMNHLRQHYIDIFAEIADADILSFILTAIHGVKCTYPKLSNTLSSLIRQSNYALC